MLKALEQKYTEILYEVNVRDDPRDPNFDIVMNATFSYCKALGKKVSDINSVEDLIRISDHLQLDPYDYTTRFRTYMPRENVWLFGLFLASISKLPEPVVNKTINYFGNPILYSDARALSEYNFIANRAIKRVKPVWDAIEKGSEEAGINLDF